MNCYINCSRIDNTIGTINSTTCSCRPKYYWDPVSVRAIINCSNISNAYPQSHNSCYCNSGYIWNSITIECFIDCSLLDNTNGNQNASVCNCIENFTWDSNVSQCRLQCGNVSNSTQNLGPPVCCPPNSTWDGTICAPNPINCSADPNADNNLNDTACNCKLNYSWNSTAKLCYVKCILYSTGNIDAN